MPNGQFGTQILGGKDAAQPRYIHTCLNDITSKLFNKLDEPLLNYINDDGYIVEPVLCSNNTNDFGKWMSRNWDWLVYKNSML